MLSINYAKVPPFLSFPLSPFHSEYILPFSNRPLLLKISRTPRRFHVYATKRKGGNYSSLVAVSIPYLWPIVACARPVTSVLPLCIVISQSHRRMATIQPLAQIYLRANDFYSIRLGLYNLTCISVCMCEHAYRVSKLQKTGTVQWSLHRFAFFALGRSSFEEYFVPFLASRSSRSFSLETICLFRNSIFKRSLG